MVAVGHTAFVVNPSPEVAGIIGMLQHLFNGAAAVTVFFVLSGFVLGLSLDTSEQPDFFKNYGEFVARRVLRIYPAFLLSISFALTYLLLVYEPVRFAAATGWFNQWYQQIPKVSQALNILTFKDIQLNNVAWTLRSEMICSCLLPFLHWINRRSGWAVNIGILGATILLGHFLRNQFLANVYLFYLGLLVPSIVRSHRFHDIRALWIYPIFAIGTVLALGAGIRLSESWLALPAGFGAFLLVVVVATEIPTLIHRVLDLEIVRFYGRISYSLYLLHFLVLHVVTFLAFRRAPAAWISSHVLITMFLLLLVSLMLVTPLAYFSWRFFEKPGIRLAKRLFQSRKVPDSKPVAIVASLTEGC